MEVVKKLFVVLITLAGLGIGFSVLGADHSRYIVKFKKSAQSRMSVQSVTRQLSALGVQASKAKSISPDHMVVEVSGDLNAVALNADSDIEYIEPDYIVHAIGHSNQTAADPHLHLQYGHDLVKSREAWQTTTGSSDVIVAVVDTGVDYNHPELSANIWQNPKDPYNGVDDDGDGLIDDHMGWNFAYNNRQPMADDYPGYHGTHVAGIVAGIKDNGLGGAGYAPNVKIMPLKFLGSNGSGQISHAIQCIYYAVFHDVDIISNSWGSNQFSRALADAIEFARARGVLFVAAAGNGGRDGVGDNNDFFPTYPAAYRHDNVIAVAATTSTDVLTSYSNFGQFSVHVAAPGHQIFSTANQGRFQYLNGTSMATPVISGVAALMKSVRPDLSYLEIKNAMLESVDQLPALQGKVKSNGRVNAQKALSLVTENFFSF